MLKNESLNNPELEDETGVYTEAFWIGFTPDPIMSVSEWADKYRVLSAKTSSEPGQWRTDRVPYLKEIMDCLSPQYPVSEVVFMKGSQIGGTEAGNNWLGYIIDVTSGTVMGVQPTVDTAKRNSKLRIDAMIEDCSRLREKVKEKRARDSGNTTLLKEFPGGVLVLTGANSAAGLRSLPARFLFLDEVDAYPGDVDGEGDPVLLAKARTRTFARRKIFAVSTPTITGRSRIEQLFEDSDQRRYLVPCPHCAGMQWLKWPQVRWPKNEPLKAVYICELCQKEIQNYQKTEMLAKGKWVATAPGEGKAAGFHLSALYSPVGWFSWPDLASEFLKATKGGPEKLRVFVNTALGETWKEKGDAPDWKRLYDTREQYPMGEVQPGVLFLTAGADVQKDRIEVEIVGWGKEKESWSIDFKIFQGDTSKAEVWEDLDKLLTTQFPDRRGNLFPIRMLAVDSSYNTNTVYSWARRYSANQVIPVKGSDTLVTMLGTPSAVDVTIRGQRLKKGVRLYSVGVNLIKAELYGWLKLERPLDGHVFPAGFCHFPQYGEEYFKQLTAERLVTRTVKAMQKHLWEKDRDRNEALDCRVYARAATAALGMDRLRPDEWEQLAEEIGALPAALAGSVEETPLENEIVPENAKDEKKPDPDRTPPAPPQRRKTSWL